ncbi:MAG: hypothetical protein KGI25_03720 [Thaumarchaeota archaeon]|nr:hypothetical protein [Nitrososphaerota archaeon]
MPENNEWWQNRESTQWKLFSFMFGPPFELSPEHHALITEYAKMSEAPEIKQNAVKRWALQDELVRKLRGQ